MSDLWKNLRAATQARIGLTRHGHAISTRDSLAFQRAHAEARDAVLKTWDTEQFRRELESVQTHTLTISSNITNRVDHLQRPDLGRTLSADSAKRLNEHARNEEAEIAIIVTDGLSAKAIENHFVPFWKVLAPRLNAQGYRLSPIIIAPFGRVGLSDDIGLALGTRLSIIFVGERPGLSSTDSMGIYLTYDPKPGNNDAGRNCISNVRPPDGLPYEVATDKLIYLVQESLRLGLSGVTLKENAHPTLMDVLKPTQIS